ncbi:1-deoxy-D-xylulose-5-phosphate synthase [Arcanobacterium phocisimile]|uniref:1-deoxy-D-xylulose-5-phosphate synthase n=1 Tax=Arcanobacterium phocisimile TaxID=1302235 RepID=A0ABX7IIT4_9ACTO|nr:1-deoxy-D-xylulose-5-phosphate synthase [Arcanobacterium phocisimile]QRV02896.1 1-deoxy-D-xylulose-5-phosphate synthase [Arcanobacterium phocisimile]
MAILHTINGPEDVKALKPSQLPALAAEIRSFLVTNVARTGGHLGPNLGVVELSIALHRVFSSPRDSLIFDTGHQSYVHKILTGRHDFEYLRQENGLSGYPSRAESVHDVVENSHASTALSWADGIARGIQRDHRKAHAVAIIGDGAMTGGMAWEALNNIAEDPDRPVVIVLNDNGRSYAPTVGGMVRRIDAVRKMDAVRVNRSYERALEWGKHTLQKSGLAGQITYDALRGLKRGVKDIFVDAGIFDSLGLKYLGPVDGHDIEQLEEALTMARKYGGPAVVHCITEKGRGYKPAEEHEADRFHAVGAIHPETGLPLVPSRFGWTSVFAEEIVEIAQADPAVVGITAAMLLPVGLGPLKKKFPDRVIDVGIAEQQALTMAAGLAYSGSHPVVALYATFMNRAYDQLLMDISLHGEPVTICLDRSGVTGDDGASHNGMWDLAIAGMIPGIKVAVPRDEKRMRELLREAVATPSPTIVRYPKGSLPEELPTVRKIGDLDIVHEHGGESQPIVLIGYGPMAHTMVEAAQQLTDYPVMVIDPRWAIPANEGLVNICAQARCAITLEDGLVAGGVGMGLQQLLAQNLVHTPVATLGIGKEFLHHASRGAVLHQQGMTVSDVVAAVQALINN